jgi:hypothetical protein
MRSFKDTTVGMSIDLMNGLSGRGGVIKTNQTQEDINNMFFWHNFPHWMLVILADPQGRLATCQKRPFQI